MRGVGQTTLMIYNLPSTRCGIVVLSSEIGREIKNQIKNLREQGLEKKVSFFVIKEEDDLRKLSGYGYPVFIDNSFLQNDNAELVKATFQRAIDSGIVYRHKDLK